MFTLCMIDNIINVLVHILSVISLTTAQHPKDPIRETPSLKVRTFFIKKSFLLMKHLPLCQRLFIFNVPFQLTNFQINQASRIQLFSN